MYDINLRATHTTILSIRGVTIPIYLVSSTTDSIRQCVVLFKPVTIPTSDPKSECLCQSSHSVQNLQTPLNHLVHLGNLPRPHPSCIILTPRALVLSSSTSNRDCTYSTPSVLVAATQLRLSRTFHSNVTITSGHDTCWKSRFCMTSK